MLYDEDGSQLAEQVFDRLSIFPGDILNLKWHLIYDAQQGLILGP